MASPPIALDALATPCLLLDQQRVQGNVERLRGRVHARGARLRLHVKTSKSIDAARLAMESPTGPIAVSTLREADYFFSHGVTDILYAVGIAPQKLDHIVALRRRGAQLAIVLDNPAAALAVADKTAATGERLEVFLEIDCDGHRSGLRPDDPALPAIAAIVHNSGATVAGVMTHAGNSYFCEGRDALQTMSVQERECAVQAAACVRAAGIPCPAVSIGSTPTASCVGDLAGVTEVRAGVFTFFDLFMAGLGVCQTQNIALSVLTTVIGHRPDRNWVIVDAGWMALSRDRGTARQTVDQGYGVVCDADGVPIEDLIVSDANQEHGIVARRSGSGPMPAALKVGTLLRIMPNHACATAAQHDRYHVIATGEPTVTAIWPRISGW